jgi:hypothetical protein
MKKVCAKMVPKCCQMNKKKSQGTVFGPFVTHWGWTRFVEFGNYLRWNLDIYVWSGNQARINAVEFSNIFKTKKKHAWAVRSSRSYCFLRYPGNYNVRVGSQQPDIKSAYYLEVMTKLSERVRRKRPKLWRNGCVLHQDNAPGHNALPAKQFLANHSITVLEHSSYSPDPAPCDFYFSPKIKSVLKGILFFCR